MRDGTRTRRRIEAEALHLFARKGVDATSVRDIALAVGVSEGALYRHTRSKEALARGLFEEAYADLARQVLNAAPGAPIEAVVEAVVAIFCRLFDESRDLFAFLLLTQHDYLSTIPVDASRNVVEAVKTRFLQAIEACEIARRDVEELSALALGLVAQPATFTLYGRLAGPLSDRAEMMTQAILAIAKTPAPEGLPTTR